MRKALLISFSIAMTLLAVTGYRTLLVHELREPVLTRLGDPKSVDFKGEVYLGNWTAAGGTLCGEVSAADAGKRTEGYQWFAAADGVFIENNDLRRQFDQAGIKRCTGDRPPNTPWWWLHW